MELIAIIGWVKIVGTPFAVAFLGWQHFILVGRINKIQEFQQKQEKQQILLLTAGQRKKLKEANLL